MFDEQLIRSDTCVLASCWWPMDRTVLSQCQTQWHPQLRGQPLLREHVIEKEASRLAGPLVPSWHPALGIEGSLAIVLCRAIAAMARSRTLSQLTATSRMRSNVPDGVELTSTLAIFARPVFVAAYFRLARSPP